MNMSVGTFVYSFLASKKASLKFQCQNDGTEQTDSAIVFI